MPVTFKVAQHDANPLINRGLQDADPQTVLSRFWTSQDTSCKELLQSSLKSTTGFRPNSNGFVKTVIEAYNRHHNLIIRPDDIWLAILSQFNLYVNAHAEELRSSFVSHEGKKELLIQTVGTRYTVDYGAMAKQFGNLLEENINDPSLREWIVPTFTTTTNNDTIISSIMMMSTLKAYFSYGIGIMCGLPSVTLLGEKADYEAILHRLPKLEEYGVEPAAFSRMLHPIVSSFVATFDAIEKGGQPNLDFWGTICHYKSGGSGPSYAGGWITAFCTWDKEGKWRGSNLEKMLEPLSAEEAGGDRYFGPPPPLVLEGVRYPVIDVSEIQNGYCEVDVKVDDNGEEFDCMMVAGHIGSVATGEKEGGPDTLQPAAEWFMFVKGDAPPKPKYW